MKKINLDNKIKVQLDESGFVGTYGIPVEFCPKCGRKLMEEQS